MNFILSSIIFTFLVFFDGYPQLYDDPIINQVSQEIPIESEYVISPAYQLKMASNMRKKKI